MAKKPNYAMIATALAQGQSRAGFNPIRPIVGAAKAAGHAVEGAAKAVDHALTTPADRAYRKRAQEARERIEAERRQARLIMDGKRIPVGGPHKRPR